MKKSQSKPTTIIANGPRRPYWISSNTRQIVIFVRDRSGSMKGQKARDASAASLALVTELAQPANKDGFIVAVVDFSKKSKIVHPLVQATALSGKIMSLSLAFISGSTNITAGLNSALAILEKAANRTEESFQYLRPVVIIFTDGCHNEGAHPEQMANRIKQQADLVTVAFGTDADEELMRSLASTPQHFYRCASGRELRDFLAAVGKTLTATMAAGTNATQALTMIQQ